MCSVTEQYTDTMKIVNDQKNYTMYMFTACSKLFLFVKSTVFIDCLNLSVSFNKQMSFGRRFQKRGDAYEKERRAVAVFMKGVFNKRSVSFFTISDSSK